MIDQSNLKLFNSIYKETYEDILKYVVIKCHNMNDVNDIVQETYFELWKALSNKQLDLSNIKPYIMGIASNKIKKHFKLIYKIRTISLFDTNEFDSEFIDSIKDKVNIEDLVISGDSWKDIWAYLKQKKNVNIPKIFYLHYKLDYTIKEISNILNLSESNIKNLLYRTIDELNRIYGGE